MEAEFVNMVKDKETKFDMLKCRLAGAAQNGVSVFLLSLLLFVGVQAFRRN